MTACLLDEMSTCDEGEEGEGEDGESEHERVRAQGGRCGNVNRLKHILTLSVVCFAVGPLALKSAKEK